MALPYICIFMNHPLPKISILVPARNEEKNLPALLRSLERLTYPKEKTEILLGNDGSDDRTGALMEEFARTRPAVKVIHLRETSPPPGGEIQGTAKPAESGRTRTAEDDTFPGSGPPAASEIRITDGSAKPSVAVNPLREESDPPFASETPITDGAANPSAAVNSPREGRPLTGKTRVLDELAACATGEYLFFTDADIELPPGWIQGMLTGFAADTGVVVGATGFHRSSLWATLQGIEWLMALSIFKLAADRGLPSTGLGNNMAVSRKAYDAVGGYRTLGFSIVEDYFLYKKIIEAGFGFRHLLTPGILSFTVPPLRYFEQRRRWIKGAMENAPAAMAGGILQALCIPLLFLLGWISPVIPAVVTGILVLIYGGLILYFQAKLRISGYLRYLPLFTVYISTAWLMQFIYYLLSRETVWKGRKY